MSTVAILLSAFVLSFVALLFFIWSQRSGLFDRSARGAEVIFAPGDTLFVERGTPLEAMIPAFRSLGHAKIDFRDPGSFKANAIERVNGRWAGAADPRSEGASVGE